MSAEEVVAQALEAVARNRPRIIPGPVVCLAITLATLIPLFALRMILQRRYEEEMVRGTV